jgi:1,4-dihydroxy-2-naphthoyl-CoA hydrolase
MGVQCHANPLVRMMERTPAELTDVGIGYLPGLLAMEITEADPDRLTCRVPLARRLMAPHGHLHGGTLVSVADSLCGYGTMLHLPAGADGFLTIELKTNFLGTMQRGTLLCEAVPQHVGRRTQVWDAVLSDEDSLRQLAVFRCTQMILWPEG